MNYPSFMVATVIAAIIGFLVVFPPATTALKMAFVILGCGVAAASYYAGTYSGWLARSGENLTRNALGALLARGERLIARIKDVSDQSVETDADAWYEEATKFVNDELGSAFVPRFNSPTHIKGSLGPTPAQERQEVLIGLIVTTTRLQEFLKEVSREPVAPSNISVSLSHTGTIEVRRASSSRPMQAPYQSVAIARVAARKKAARERRSTFRRVALVGFLVLTIVIAVGHKSSGISLPQNRSNSGQAGANANINLTSAPIERTMVQQTAEIVGPLTFNESHVQLPLKFTLTNVGKDVADDAFVWSNIFPVDSESVVTSVKERPAACAHPRVGWTEVGMSVPPGAAVSLTTMLVGLPLGRALPPGRWILTVVGCAIYRSGQNAAIHQTPFFLRVRHQVRGPIFDARDGDVGDGLELTGIQINDPPN